MNDLLTVKTFDNAIDAHLFRIELESNGIAVYIVDEEIVSVNPLYAQAVGGIKVKVHRDDLEKVTFVLTREEMRVKTEIYCPRCGSDQVRMKYRSIRGFKSFIIYLISKLLTSFATTGDYVQKCKECGLEFKRPAEHIDYEL